MMNRVLLALIAVGAASFARGQTLPQSTPSSDWASFSDAGAAAQPAALGVSSPYQAAPAPTSAPPPAVAAPDAAPTTTAPLATPPPPAPIPTDAVVQPVVASERVVPAPLTTPGTGDNPFDSAANTRLTSSLMGPVGLYKVLSAEPGTRGVLRMSLTGQFFTDDDFPVKEANDSRQVGTLTLAFTPLRFLDVYVGTQISANNSTGTHGTDPSFVSELGDFWGGIKFGGFVARGIGLALDLRGAAYSGVGSNGLGAGAFMPTGIVTIDMQELTRFPLRLHVNFGGRFGDLVDLGVTNAAGQAVALRAPEQFALGASSFNSELRASAAAEFPLPWVTPFVEYNVILPLGSGVGSLVGPDQAPVSYGDALPNDLDIGVRFTGFRDVSLLAGVDIAFQKNVALGVPILPPWELFLGLAYNVDLFAENKVTIVDHSQLATTLAPAMGTLNGTVLEQDTRAAIAGALVQVGTGTGLVATDATGHFQSYELPPGLVDVTATHDGYKSATAKATIAVGQPAMLEVLMTREAKPASIKVSAHSGGKPVAAQVSVSGLTNFTQDLKLADDGTGQVAVPGAGSYVLKVTADGYLGQLKKVELGAGTAGTLDVELSPAPKKTGLIISEKKIKLRRQVHFETGQATILPDSSGILDELLSAILTRNIQKLRVEGHSDNVGGAAKNQKLSQDRADSVMQWLASHGVPADRLEAVGYGDTRPVAPNLTARGRALNRRVEFDIL